MGAVLPKGKPTAQAAVGDTDWAVGCFVQYLQRPTRAGVPGPTEGKSPYAGLWLSGAGGVR